MTPVIHSESHAPRQPRPPSVEITFGSLGLERHRTGAAYLLLDVGADLELRVHDRVLFREPDFPVLELAVALLRWIPAAESLGEGESLDFDYTSAEAEESPLIAFAGGSGGYFIRSPWQVEMQEAALPLGDLIWATREYVARVTSSLESELGIDIEDVLRDETAEAHLPSTRPGAAP